MRRSLLVGRGRRQRPGLARLVLAACFSLGRCAVGFRLWRRNVCLARIGGRLAGWLAGLFAAKVLPHKRLVFLLGLSLRELLCRKGLVGLALPLHGLQHGIGIDALHARVARTDVLERIEDLHLALGVEGALLERFHGINGLLGLLLLLEAR